MDILDFIKKDHRQIDTLFSEIEATDDTQKLYHCFNQLYEEINLHAEVESQTFYPAIRECTDSDGLVNEAQKEHDQAKQLLEEIEFLSPTSEEFKAKIRELKQVIQHHVQEEENEIFSQVRQYMNEEKRAQLGREFEAVKSKLHSEMSIAS